MRKLLAVTAVALIALLAAASTAFAHGNERGGRHHHGHGHKRGHDKKRGHKRNHEGRSFKCNGSFTGVTINTDVVVPQNGACTLRNSTVKADVKVLKNAYFQATGASIRGDVAGDGAQTVFIDTGSSVTGVLRTDMTAQVFAFNSTIKGGIGIYRATDKVNVCGNTVKGEGIAVVRSGRDILVGDPLTIGCAGNTVLYGSVLIGQNNTDVELVVRGNTITKGGMFVLDNAGSSNKFVQSNTAGKMLRCTGNGAPFTGSPNPGWQQYQGQCGA